VSETRRSGRVLGLAHCRRADRAQAFLRLFDAVLRGRGATTIDDRQLLRGAEGLESSWRIIAGSLERWTPDMLFEQYERQADKRTQVHTRQSVLMRLLSHDAYHSGELSQTLGIEGLPQIDLWRPD